MMTDLPAAPHKVDGDGLTRIVWLPFEVPVGLYCWYEGKWCKRFSINNGGPQCSIGFKLSWKNKNSRRGVDKSERCLELGGRK